MKLNYGDIIEIQFGDKIAKFEITYIPESNRKKQS